MDRNLLQFAITAFVMLVVVVNPFAVATVFVSVTAGLTKLQRKAILNRALMISFGVAMFFLLLGPLLLSYLGVTLNAFSISGGMLLFVIAFRMLFGQRSAPPPSDDAGDDVAVFPLTIPQLVGPGTIATILVLSVQAGRDMVKLALVALAIVVVYLISWPTLYSADWLMTRMGHGKVNVLTRVMGVILAALAVQYVLNGAAGFYSSLGNLSR